LLIRVVVHYFTISQKCSRLRQNFFKIRSTGNAEIRHV
jgi:hypothetical protein